MRELPDGWLRVPLSEVAIKIGSGATPKGGHAAYAASGTPLIRSQNVHFSGFSDVGLAYLDEAQAQKLDGVTVCENDVLLNITGASIGRVTVAPERMEGARVNQHVAIIRLLAGIEPVFLAKYLAAPLIQQFIVAENYGVTRQALTKAMIEEIELPVPPLPEQRRIVEKIDSLTGKSKRARDHLDHVPRLVDKYKQAVLAAAFRGELTLKWRATRVSVPSPATIVREVGEARSVLAVGKSRSRPNEEASAGSRVAVALGTLPTCWASTTLEKVTDPTRVIQYGILKPGPDVDEGIPYVKVMNIRNERINAEAIRKTSAAIHGQYRRSAIREGDILLTIRGTVGRLAFVPAELDGGNITQDSVRIAVLPPVNPRYVFLYLLSPFAQGYFAENQKGVAVRGINVGDVRPMEMPLPSRDEQDEIVRRVEIAIVWIDRLASEATNARRLIDRLDQAVLAKAFRGELVPQDPADEPASVLLDRIRTERGAALKVKRERKVKA